MPCANEQSPWSPCASPASSGAAPALDYTVMAHSGCHPRPAGTRTDPEAFVWICKGS